MPRDTAFVVFFFFFQAEDGIRDLTVTGVQTCALPISIAPDGTGPGEYGLHRSLVAVRRRRGEPWDGRGRKKAGKCTQAGAPMRSEERRGGKECRSRGSPYH